MASLFDSLGGKPAEASGCQVSNPRPTAAFAAMFAAYRAGDAAKFNEEISDYQRL